MRTACGQRLTTSIFTVAKAPEAADGAVVSSNTQPILRPRTAIWPPVAAPTIRKRLMNSPATKTLRLGHSPDPDDAFMFYALAQDPPLIPTGHWRFEHVLQDIQTL